MGYNNVDLIFSNFAKGKHTFKEILEKYDIHVDELEIDASNDNDTLTQRFLRKARGLAKGVRVGGIGNAMISFPKCCSPIPGDKIIGYITRGKGVTVHRVNCKNLPIKQNRDRIIDVEWDLSSSDAFLVRLKIVFEDRKDLLKDLTESTSSLNINIKSVDISALDGLATCLMIIEVENITELETLQKKIINSINPIKIERI
jgi:GTP pyrophosphokinase